MLMTTQLVKIPDPFTEHERSLRIHKLPSLDPRELGIKIMLARTQPLRSKFLSVHLTAHSNFSGQYKVTGL
jgi:hypothetical protein